MGFDLDVEIDSESAVSLSRQMSSVQYMNLTQKIKIACQRREQLHTSREHTGYRLFHGPGEGQPGLTIERLGDFALIDSAVDLRPEWDAMSATLLTETPVSSVILRVATPGARSPEPPPLSVIAGQKPGGPIEILEHDLRFQVFPEIRHEGGFFFDARPARAWLLANSRHRRILNLFAHTGSLGVASAAGGARSVLHVDSKKSPLAVAKEHHRLNDLPADDRSFLRGNVYQQLIRARKAGVQVDGIILDPPPQLPRKFAPKKPVGQDFAQLTKLARPLLAPGGWLLCFFHRFDRTRSEFEHDVQSGAGESLEVTWRSTSGIDFPEQNPEHKLRLTVFQIANDQ